MSAPRSAGRSGEIKAWRFDFTDGESDGKVREGYAAVLPEAAYTAHTGYGWQTAGRIKTIYYPCASAIDKSFPGHLPRTKGQYGSGFFLKAA